MSYENYKRHEKVEHFAQDIIDRFFDLGAKVNKKDFDFVVKKLKNYYKDEIKRRLLYD